MMRTLRYPYIELMFAKRAKTGRRCETETSPTCLLATGADDDATPYRNARHEMRTRTT